MSGPLPRRRKPPAHGPNSVRLEWTLWQRFIHWRMRRARSAVHSATFYRRQRPSEYERAKAREDRWTRRWIDTFRKVA